MTCLGDWIAWSSAGINVALAAWQITHWRRLTQEDKRQAQRWLDEEIAHRQAWAQRRRELEDEWL
jgi:hypothetical protein